MDQKRPQGRQRNVTGTGKSVSRRGSGLNTGPVGQSSAPAGGSQQRSGSGTRAGGTRLPLIVIILVLLLGGGGGIFGSDLLGGGDSVSSDPVISQPVSTPAPTPASSSYSGLNDALSGYLGGSSVSPYANLIGGSSASGWTETANVESLNDSVASGARAKYTQLKGGGKDTVTIMVYMCGTDLESRSGMASSDLQEMTQARLSDNVTVLIYTGGCTQWRNTTVSSSVNQIYSLTSDGLRRVVSDAGSVSMTKPDTLSSFIKWCHENYPADREELIFWDHGGGSVSGYGYDQKFPQSGSMSLAGINTALKDAGVKFDFIGFDACLMSTMETALMLDSYADYMIASEETEPGIGWYYTDWLTALSRNSSMTTLQLGRNIVDDFVSTCASKCRGQSATLSVIDLAELSATAPGPMKAFSQSLTAMIQSGEYQKVSSARNSSQEFARSSSIDQIDLAHFAGNVGSSEGRALAEAIRGAVKYNRTSSNIANAYGLSIYFPYRKANKVDAAVSTYKAIGMDDSYSQCIREFASLEVSGQAASGADYSPLYSLLGNGYSDTGSSDLINGLLSNFLGGDFSSIPGLSGSNTDFFSGRSLSQEETVDYLTANHFDASALVWTQNANGETVISLPEDQWALIEGLELNLFLDDGEGYIDMGLDNVFDFDEFGNLLAPAENAWLAVNDQPVAYYHEFTLGLGENAIISGRIPAFLNGQRVDLLVQFDSEHPTGAVMGARPVYADGETDTVAKALIELEDGDVIDFICDYYRYDGSYENSYLLGDQMIYDGELRISDVLLEDAVRMSYRFTDLYQQNYWTAPIS